MPNSEDSFAKWPCMSGIITLITVLQSKKKNMFRQFAPTCAVKIINQCLTVRIAQQKSLAPLVYTLMTVFQIKEKLFQSLHLHVLYNTLITVLQSKKKNMFQAICTNLCCKNYQSVPNSEDSLAKQLSTSGIYLYHSIVEHRKKHVLSIAPTLYMCCKIMINQCLTVRIP